MTLNRRTVERSTPMNKKLVLVFLAGWALALIVPPQRLLAMVKGKSA